MCASPAPPTLPPTLLQPPPEKGAWRLLFPTRCTFCGSRAGGTALCPTCAQRLPALAADNAALQARLACEWLPRAVAVWQYEGLARGAVLGLKYGGEVFRARELAREALLTAQAAGLPQPHLILPVPDAPRAAAKKSGPSAPQALAAQLCRQLGLPAPPAGRRAVLYKPFDTLAQHRLPAALRAGNPVGAYALRDPQQVRGKVIWLVDDVVTTGATLRECARLLWLYGAAQVAGLCVCATPAHRLHPSPAAAAPGADEAKEGGRRKTARQT